MHSTNRHVVARCPTFCPVHKRISAGGGEPRVTADIAAGSDCDENPTRFCRAGKSENTSSAVTKADRRAASRYGIAVLAVKNVRPTLKKRSKGSVGSSLHNAPVPQQTE